MVYIPLLIGLKTPTDIARVNLLGIIMLWTYAPLIPGLDGAILKNLFLLA
jgi:hypothetical protein